MFLSSQGVHLGYLGARLQQASYCLGVLGGALDRLEGALCALEATGVVPRTLSSHSMHSLNTNSHICAGRHDQIRGRKEAVGSYLHNILFNYDSPLFLDRRSHRPISGISFPIVLLFNSPQIVFTLRIDIQDARQCSTIHPDTPLPSLLLTANPSFSSIAPFRLQFLSRQFLLLPAFC